MKITFEDDGSFLEFLPESDKITVILCGRKSYNQVTMSNANISEEQVSEIIEFLLEWKNKKII